MDAKLKRSFFVAVLVWQLLLGLLLSGLAIYLLTLTRSREILAEPDSVETVQGLWIGAGVFGVPGLVTLVGVWGLWKSRFWGWVLSLATDVGVAAVLLYNFVGDGDRDVGEITFVAGFVVAVILLLLPVVRKVFWTQTGSPGLAKPV